jgi:hypothetical protein
MRSDFVEKATAIADKLRLLDRRRVVFGSSRHAHRFHPPLAMQEVESFESTHGVSLPAPYRSFITELGNGGMGPYYGITPLDLDAPQLRQTFPYTETYTLPDDADDDAWESEIPGAISICEYGCGIFLLLVVRGEAAGQVWFDGRAQARISPVERKNQPADRFPFDVWWLSVMGDHCERFERILALMNAGISHEEIHSRLEPGTLQLHVDETMLSIMNQDPQGTPRVCANKPWGQACGLVEEHYDMWLRMHGRREKGGREKDKGG